MRAFPPLLGLLLIVGSAAAAPLRMVLDSTTQASVEGLVEVTGHDALLDLAPAVKADPSLNISAIQVSGHRGVRLNDDNPIVNRPQPGGYSEESLSFGPGVLTEIRCLQGCTFVMLASGINGSVGVRGEASGDLVGASKNLRRCATWCGGTDYVRDFPPGTLEVGSANSGAATQWDGTTPSISGIVQLLMTNVAATFREVDGTEHTLEVEDSVRPGGPGNLFTERQYSFYLLELRDPQLNVAPDAPLFARLIDPTLRIDGRVLLDEATGTIEFRGAKHDVHGEDVRVDGDVVFEAPPRQAVDRTVAPTRGPSSGDIEGDATQLTIGAATYGTPGTSVSAAAPAVGASVILVGALMGLARLLIVPLYSRISSSRVLENANRQRIMDAVQATPGSTVTTLSRVLNIPRIVVRHHVAMLAAHSLVVLRTEGRSRGLYPPARAPSGEAQVLAQLLRDPTRREIAERIAASAGLTQGDLARLTGRSQRLVSHHVGRLIEAGLVEARPTTPKTYIPANALATRAGAQPHEGSAA